MSQNTKIPTALCKCCEIEEVEWYDICDNCGWQYDDVQNNDPNYEGGANELSLNQYRKQWQRSNK